MVSSVFSLQVPVIKIVNHSKKAAKLAKRYGWLPGARYTNLRDVRTFDRLGFLDIDWKSYDYRRHLEVARDTRPLMTVARDIERSNQLSRTIDQAYALNEHADVVIIVPKCPSIARRLDELIPKDFVLGFSVPTKYGATSISPSNFRRPVHLLGGRPDRQRQLAELMPVVSLDCNRFTLDAAFGDYFDGETFRPHPLGGYDNCLRDSIRNINLLWANYRSPNGKNSTRRIIARNV